METEIKIYKEGLKEKTMKTICIKAEVLDTHRFATDRIKIGGKYIDINKQDLKKAQVLAVEGVQDYCNNSGNSINIYKNGMTILTNKKMHSIGLPELTELVRGKERTLEDVVRTMLKQASHILTDEVKQEAEQLLKNRELWSLN